MGDKRKECEQPEWKRVKFYENKLRWDLVIPKKWLLIIVLGMFCGMFLLLILFGYIHGTQVIHNLLLTGILFISFYSLFLIFFPPATLCKKVGFGEEMMYVFNGLNKLIGKPLCIPYSSITKLFYNPWLKIYGVDYYTEKGRKSSYGVIFTKENMERLREKLRELKEKGKWHGKLEVVPLVTVGMASIPEDEVEEFERRKKVFEKW